MPGLGIKIGSADALRIGDSDEASYVYLGSNQVWPEVAPPENPITFVGESHSIYTTTQYASVNNPGVTLDDYILIGYIIGAGDPPVPTTPLGFSLLAGPYTVTDGTSFKVVRYVFGKFAGASEPSTYEVDSNATTSNPQATLLAYRGVNKNTPLDATPVPNNAGGTSFELWFPDTVTPNTMLVAFAHDWGQTTKNLTPPSGFTERTDTTIMYACDKLKVAAGVTDGAIMANNNTGTNDPWGMIGLALRPAGSSAPPDTTVRIDPDTSVGVQPYGETSGWTLVDSEEFNGSMTVVDSAKGFVKFRSDGSSWATWYPDWNMFATLPGANHNNDNYECYYDTSKVDVSAGTLKLACDRQTTVAGLDYTAGMITTIPSSRNYKYGSFEIRARVIGGDTGNWPAFWTTSSATNTWNSEIDIWETTGSNTAYVSNVYIDSSGTSGGSGTWVDGPAQTLDNDWHIYRCTWDATGTKFYRDGVLTSSTTSTPNEKHYLLINNGVKTSSSPSFTSSNLEVDYVRVWKAA